MDHAPGPLQVFILFVLALYLTAVAFVFDARGDVLPTAAVTAGGYGLAWLLFRAGRHA